MEEVSFFPAFNRLKIEEVCLDLTGKAWNGRSRFWPNWNGLKWRKSVLTIVRGGGGGGGG
jgi:hypothetical protein